MSKNSRFEKALLSVWEIRRRVVRVTDTQQNNASHLSIEEQCPECGQWLARTAAIHGPAKDGFFVCSGKVFEARDQRMLAATPSTTLMIRQNPMATTRKEGRREAASVLSQAISGIPRIKRA